jgi:uncharacterized protein YidB (DUF937 family)
VDGLSSVRLDIASMGAIQSPSQSQHVRKHPGMDAAASLLGMSASDLRTALRGGQSLSSIASSKGVSQDQLVAAMSTAIQQANPGMSADRATNVATAIATRTPPAGGGPGGAVAPPPGTDAAGQTGPAGAGHGHHHRHHAMAAAMQAAATTLGLSADQLASSLKSGQSLSALASSKGVSQDDLVKSISAALQQADTDLSADQATQIATGLATAVPQSQSWQPAGGGVTSTFGVTA